MCFMLKHWAYEDNWQTTLAIKLNYLSGIFLNGFTLMFVYLKFNILIKYIKFQIISHYCSMINLLFFL